MKVLILGADGYLGWPTAMHLSALGHQVILVDNFLKRKICSALSVQSLTDVLELEERVRVWNQSSGKTVEFHYGDITNAEFLNSIFQDCAPEACVHYAEQPSGPYSMLNQEAASLTVSNNVMGTLNVIYAIHNYAPQCHLIKLGTMGEYGTPNIDIEEGWLDVEHQGRRQKFLYPRQASSLYHTSKIMDTDLIWFYVRTWNLKVTDLMQGPVYGVFTDQNIDHEQLLPHFYYDEIMGTVLNRFIVQAACSYPLTVYGKGGQTRGYLNIKDTLQCIELSLSNPATQGELRIFNQIVETFTVEELAQKVIRVADRMGLKPSVQKVSNPRVEKEEHYYNAKATSLVDLGLKPTYLDDLVIEQLLEFAVKRRENIDQSKIFNGLKWT